VIILEFRYIEGLLWLFVTYSGTKMTIIIKIKHRLSKKKFLHTKNCLSDDYIKAAQLQRHLKQIRYLQPRIQKQLNIKLLHPDLSHPS